MLFSQAFCSRSSRTSILPVLSRPYAEFLPEEKGRRVIVTCRHSGKRCRCVFLYSVHKGMSLRGKMKKMGPRSFSKCISVRDAYYWIYVGRLHPLGIFPFIFTASMRDYSASYFSGTRRMGFFQSPIVSKMDRCEFASGIINPVEWSV